MPSRWAVGLSLPSLYDPLISGILSPRRYLFGQTRKQKGQTIMDAATTASNNLASVMQRHWKRYLLLIALVVVLVCVGWRAYTNYQLHAYTRQMADSIPVPPDVRLIEQQQNVDKECRSAGIRRYYATNRSWEEVLSIYQNYLGSSPWNAFIPNEYYFWSQSPANQRLQLVLGQIKNAQSDTERQTVSSGKVAYIVQVSYTQDIAAWEKNCKPED